MSHLDEWQFRIGGDGHWWRRKPEENWKRLMVDEVRQDVEVTQKAGTGRNGKKRERTIVRSETAQYWSWK